MDRNENLYFDEFSKKSLSEIQEMFQNLKHIGMSDEDIDKFAKEYKQFFEQRNAEISKHSLAYKEIERREKVYDTSIPWREKLMERAEIKKTLRDELINLKKDEN